MASFSKKSFGVQVKLKYIKVCKFTLCPRYGFVKLSHVLSSSRYITYNLHTFLCSACNGKLPQDEVEMIQK